MCFLKTPDIYERWHPPDNNLNGLTQTERSVNGLYSATTGSDQALGFRTMCSGGRELTLQLYSNPDALLLVVSNERDLSFNAKQPQVLVEHFWCLFGIGIKGTYELLSRDRRETIVF